MICHDMLCNGPKNRATFEDFSFSKVDPTLAPSVPMAFAKSRPWLWQRRPVSTWQEIFSPDFFGVKTP